MRILELKIKCLRGIPTLDLVFNGNSQLFVGHNGTGKSSIIDALDFVFTGEIERLTGRQGASVKDHGKHISSTKDQCVVVVKIKVEGFQEPIQLTRCLATHKHLDIEPKEAIKHLITFLSSAHNRQFLLTRKNLLRCIYSDPKDRAGYIQSLLNLTRIEELRMCLTRASNSTNDATRASRTNIVTCEGAAQNTLMLTKWNLPLALREVNRHRETLKADPISDLSDVKRDVTPPGTGTKLDEPSKIKTPLDVLPEILRLGKSMKEDAEAELNSTNEKLLDEIQKLSSDPAKLRAAKAIELIELGISKLDDGNNCPLCDKEWPEGALAIYLGEKLQTASSAAASRKIIKESVELLLRWIADSEATIQTIAKAGKHEANGIDPVSLNNLKNQLAKLRFALNDPLKSYVSTVSPSTKLSDFLGISEHRQLLRDLYLERSKAKAKSPEQISWDILTGLEQNLNAIKAAKVSNEKNVVSARRLDALLTCFVEARDNVLDALYISVKDRFIAIYKELHAPDEQSFDAEFTPTNAGLILDVDFRNSGKAAPFAMHSEGHQDSMGLCLFLALSEKSQGLAKNFCLLDDVIMAIDAGHRIKVARLIKKLQANTQFIVTTHDQVWAKQLKAEGCFKSDSTHHIISWTLGGGPVFGNTNVLDFIKESEDALKSGNVRDAAASLRNGLEWFFHVTADAIKAQPPYSISSQYEFGQLYIACNRKLSELVKKAKNAGSSWGNTEFVEYITKFDELRKKSLVDGDREQWAINSNVHFNEWMTMTADEFAPVVQTFKEICDIYKCPTCGTSLFLSFDGIREKSVTCSGGCKPWNLELKS